MKIDEDEIPEFLRSSEGESNSRALDVPSNLSAEALGRLTVAKIEAEICGAGAALAYAGMLKLAAGQGKTPPGTQYHACAFLLDRAAELTRSGGESREVGERLRALPRDVLLDLIGEYERIAAETAASKPPIEIN